MTNINMDNHSTITGNLVRPPWFSPLNSDGSQSVRLTVAYKGNYVPKGATEAPTKTLDLEAYVTADQVKSKNSPYDYMTTGSHATFAYEAMNKAITRRGQDKPDYRIVAEIRGVKLLDSNETFEARKKKAEAAEAAKASKPVSQEQPAGEAVDPLA